VTLPMLIAKAKKTKYLALELDEPPGKVGRHLCLLGIERDPFPCGHTVGLNLSERKMNRRNSRIEL
jgi:hypothetical protein